MREVDKIAELLGGSNFAVALSGAGISTESGIPDFRGPDGLWKKVDPSFASIQFLQRAISDPTAMKKLLSLLAPIVQKLLLAKPNPAHYALAELEKIGKIKAVITQNIDGLHQLAGSKNVIEVHGTYKRATCLGCGKSYSLDEMIRRFSSKFLGCDCGGFIKPDVVFFGEALPQDALSSAFSLAERCDVLLVVGSSLTVYPIASVVDLAKRSGARILMINMEPTAKDHLADCILKGKVGEVLPEIVEKVKLHSR